MNLQVDNVYLDKLIERGRAIAENGTAQLEAWWKDLTQLDRRAIGAALLDSWKRIAKDVDEHEKETTN